MQAFDNFKDMADGLGSFGNFLSAIFQNEFAMFFIILFIIAIMLSTLIKKLLSNIPMFKGSGEAVVNKQGNVIAWCLSLLCVLSIGWMTKEQGPSAVVNAFAGPMGVYMVLALSVLAGYGAWKNTERLSRWGRWAWTLGIGFVVYAYLTTALSGVWGSEFNGGLMVWFIVCLILGAGAALATHLWGRGP